MRQITERYSSTVGTSKEIHIQYVYGSIRCLGECRTVYKCTIGSASLPHVLFAFTFRCKPSLGRKNFVTAVSRADLETSVHNSWFHVGDMLSSFVVGSEKNRLSTAANVLGLCRVHFQHKRKFSKFFEADKIVSPTCWWQQCKCGMKILEYEPKRHF